MSRTWQSAQRKHLVDAALQQRQPLPLRAPPVDLSKPGALQPGEYKLSWPPTGAAKTEWKINSGLLRQEMGNLRPIRDASPGNTGGMYLNAERNLLTDRGWKFDPATNYWLPPKL